MKIEKSAGIVLKACHVCLMSQYTISPKYQINSNVFEFSVATHIHIFLSQNAVCFQFILHTFIKTDRTASKLSEISLYGSILGDIYYMIADTRTIHNILNK